MQQQPENELKEELESQMRSTVLTRAANLFNARLLRSIEEFRIEQGVGEGTYGFHLNATFFFPFALN